MLEFIRVAAGCNECGPQGPTGIVDQIPTCDFEGSTLLGAEGETDSSSKRLCAAPSVEIPHGVMRPHQG